MPLRQGKAKLLFEKINDISFIKENSIAGKSENYYIEGIFQEADVKNQNGRIYPYNILMPEIDRFVEKYVKTDRAVGELDHPSEPTINLDRVSHKIIRLWKENKKVYGKAIIGGPLGDAVKKLMDMGVRLGVSSRSLGSLDSLNRVTDLQLVTWDIVHEPSVSTAMMETIIESKEFDWIKDDDDIFYTQKMKKNLKIINNNKLLTDEERNLYVEMLFNDFFKKLSKQ